MKGNKYYLCTALGLICTFLLIFPVSISYSQAFDTQTIIEVQKKLIASGYDLGVADGILGSKTEKALKEYQLVNGLMATGKPDKATLDNMGINGEKALQPIDSILLDIRDGLDSSWGIQNVELKDGDLIFELYHDSVTTNVYLSMMRYICIELVKYPDLIKQIKGISVLNNDRSQGWTFPETGRIEWITNAGSRESDRYILRNSNKFTPDKD